MPSKDLDQEMIDLLKSRSVFCGTLTFDRRDAEEGESDQADDKVIEIDTPAYAEAIRFLRNANEVVETYKGQFAGKDDGYGGISADILAAFPKVLKLALTYETIAIKALDD